ncbi:Bis(5'nucleosyl)-tetraphosphatase, partial [gut metagenome]
TALLDFKQKEDVGSAPKSLVPWFKFHGRVLKDQPICFGHWSMLGLINSPTIIAIDTGCLWGGELTAVRFPDRKIIQEKCPCWADPWAFK